MDTIFIDSLPYRATLFISPAINPDWAKEMSKKQAPFVFDDKFNTDRLADGGLQLSLVLEKSFGQIEDHLKVLVPAVGELRTALAYLTRRLEILGGMRNGGSYGLAKFGRIYAEKRRTLGLGFSTTSFYFPDLFSRIKKLDKKVFDSYLLAIAYYEKDGKEIGHFEKAPDQAREGIRLLEEKISVLENTLNKAEGKTDGVKNRKTSAGKR